MCSSDLWFDTVLGAYRAEGRQYHGVRHVAWVVHHVQSIAADHPVVDIDATVAAAFFHALATGMAPVDAGEAAARAALVSVDKLDSVPRQVLGIRRLGRRVG